MSDMTITFRRERFDELPADTQILIGQFCGPLYPDRDGVLTMMLTPGAWADIERSIAAH